MSERRSRSRFPIQREVRWRQHLAGHALTPHYETSMSVDIASHGLHVAVFGPRPSVHTSIDASIDWPILLDGTTPLQLRVSGHVVRETAEGFAMTIEQHEFRTRRAAVRASVA